MPRASAARPPTPKVEFGDGPLTEEATEPPQELTFSQGNEQDGEAPNPEPIQMVTKPGTATKKVTDQWDNPLGFITIDETVNAYNFCLYGKEGSGKTTAAAKIANTGSGRVLFVNAEGGLKKAPLQKRGVDTSKLVIWPNPASGQKITRSGLEQVYQQLQADLIQDPTSWTAVIFDSATEIHTAILDEVTAKRVDKSERLGKTGDAVDPFFTDRGDYGTMSKMFRDLLRKFRDLPCHFILTALERRDVDDDTSEVHYGPAVTPGLQSDIMGYVDFVLAFKQADEKKPYRAATKRAGKYRAKDRLDVLPAVLNEPGLDRVLAYVEGALDEGSDPLQAKPETDSAATEQKTPQTALNEEKN
jgi:hypothetical protein